MKKGRGNKETGRAVSGQKPVKRAAASSPESTQARSKARPASFRSLPWVLLALIAVNLIIYAPAWHYGFLSWDDPLYVSKNAEVTRGLTWHGVVWAFTTGHSANWHPLTWLSHMLDVQLYGMAAGPHHLTNILLHIANTLLLFWVLRRMTGAWCPSAVVAGLFAAHPLHVESVAWIAERKDVLSTLFWMLTIYTYIGYVRRPRFGRHLAVVAIFALGLMTKPMLVTLPLVLLLLDIWPLGRVQLQAGQRKVWWALAREKIPLFGLSIASSVVTIAVQWRGGTVADFELLSSGRRIANALVSYVAYICKTIWPTDLIAYYPYEPQPRLWMAGSILILIVVSVMAIRFAGRHPYFLVGWLWYLCTLLPVIGLVQVGGQSIADRYTYVPLVGVFIIAAWGIPELLRHWQHHRTLLQAAAVLPICVFAVVARNQVRYWKNDLALWEHTVQAKAGNYFACTNLGLALAASGDYDAAAARYMEALRIKPDFAEAHNALGVVFFKQGRLHEAEIHYLEALRYKPRFAEAHSNLGTVLGMQGKTQEAVSEFLEALKISPDNAEVHYNLGFALADQGRDGEAAAQFHEALRIDPAYADAYNKLGNILLNRGKLGEAIAQYTEALHINPDFAEAHNNLGVALIDQKRSNEAIAHFTEALRIKPGWADALNNLGVALMNIGRNAEAIACFKEILSNDPNDTHARQNLEDVLANEAKN
jgi:tetratricopeptide (TPR) repeat protein